MLCEEVTDSVPTDALTTWKDGDATFCLRPNHSISTNSTSPPQGDLEAGRFYTGENSRAAYKLSDNVICKVSSWREGKQLESETVKFVKQKVPSVPVPEVIYEWIDRAWQRTFYLMKRVPGENLSDAWPRLSQAEVGNIARELVEHIHALSKLTSPWLETANGCGVTEAILLGEPDSSDGDTSPSWKPYLHPRYSPQTLTSHLATHYHGETPPASDDRFCFYHDDLVTRNLFVSIPTAEGEMTHLTAIIDWETAGYYPRWWIDLKPRVSPAFHETAPNVTDASWSLALGHALAKAGFSHDHQWFYRYIKKDTATEEARRQARVERLEREKEQNTIEAEKSKGGNGEPV